MTIKVSINYRDGYILFKEQATKTKYYRAVLWDGPDMRPSKRWFFKASQAAEYGHRARRRYLDLQRAEINAGMFE